MVPKRCMIIVCMRISTLRDRIDMIYSLIGRRFYVMGFDKETGEPIKANCVESVFFLLRCVDL